MPSTKREFLGLAYQYATSLHMQHKFNEASGRAGERFYSLIMNRHKELSIGMAQNLSLARINGWRKEKVDEFF